MKNFIESIWGIPSSKQKLFRNNTELKKNNKTLSSYCLFSKGVIYLLDKRSSQFNLNFIKILENFGDYIRDFEEQIHKIQTGISLGFMPKLVESGVSGTYFLCGTLGENIVNLIYRSKKNK